MTPEQLKQAVMDFKEIYKQEYGIELSDKEASKKALSMLQLFDVLTSNTTGVLL